MWNHLGTLVFPDHGWFWYEELEAASEGAVAAEQLYGSTSIDII